MGAPIEQLSPAEAQQRLQSGWDALLLDLREPWEYEQVHLPGSTLVPLAVLPSKMAELDPARPVLTICHHGIRSWHAACLLEQNGFETVCNLAGGIDAWARELDPGMPRY